MRSATSGGAASGASAASPAPSRGACAPSSAIPIGSAAGLGDLAGSIGRMLRPVTTPLSPIMRDRSLSIRFDTLAVPVDRLKAAAARAHGRLNDAFVAGVAGGLRRYHEAHGAPVPALRMSMPINVRERATAAVAGNQFVPARFEVPVGIVSPVERMAAIRELVGQQRGEPALRLLDEVAALLCRLPLAVSTALFGSMLRGIDFVTSNVPGPRFDLYVAGARIEGVVGYGPLTGAATNVTLFSVLDRAHLGITTDPAAVPDAEAFVAAGGGLRGGARRMSERAGTRSAGSARRVPSSPASARRSARLRGCDERLLVDRVDHHLRPGEEARVVEGADLEQHRARQAGRSRQEMRSAVGAELARHADPRGRCA